MKTIYIAGPFRAATAWAIEANVFAAARWALEVAKLGAVPVIPHTMYRFFHGTLPDAFWLEATLALLRLCDGMLLVDHLHSKVWRASEGVHAEMNEMDRLGRPVFFLDDLETDSLAAWIKKGT